MDSKGYVTAVSPGEATISCTITTKKGKEQILDCLVTTQIPVTKLLSEEKTVTVNPGASRQLSWVIEPADATLQTLEWSSQNSEIVSVDENGVVTAGSYTGSGCAISQASADMMIDLVIGKTKEEALELADIFMGMVRSTASPEEVERLEEAAALESVAHMPARVKCATLGWKTMQKMLKA